MITIDEVVAKIARLLLQILVVLSLFNVSSAKAPERAAETSNASTAVGPCINGLCPKGYSCKDGSCFRAENTKAGTVFRSRATPKTNITNAVGPCVGDECPRGYVCVQQMCYPDENVDKQQNSAITSNSKRVDFFAPLRIGE
ncbi:unnamed protein product [Toxocara canis]|uniref:CC domain-containing protein n=1 Tax=Toxocara canis TaxID=6265 RepID=A0A183UBF5_TOXCA|nr:unnamed protein product [Toxocara canis]